MEVAPNQQANILVHFSMERGMRIINQVQAFSYIRESYQQLRGWSLLVTDVLHNAKRSMV
jgi:hypothetical protein